MAVGFGSGEFFEEVGVLDGGEIVESPEAHLPRSRMRQRSEQKGKYSSVARTTLRQVGQKRALGAVLIAESILAR